MAWAAACTPAGSAPQPAAPGDVVLEVPRLGDAGPTSSGGGVRFGRVPPSPGERWTVSVRARSRMIDAPGTEQLAGYESDFDVEVLATNGVAPSRVALRFARNVDVYQGAAKPTPLDGKSYVLDATPPRVRDASGGAAPEAEADRLLDVLPDLGMRTGIDQVLPDDPMHVGERRDDLANAVLAVIHPRAWKLRTGTAKLVRFDANEAAFAVTLDAVSTNGVQMAVAGEVRVRVRDARLAAIELEGTYEASASVKGTIEIRRTVKDR